MRAHKESESSVIPPQFTLRQLECFVAVADRGSLAGAAAALHASDSAVADALTAMERSLGALLIHRQRARGATLTSDGLAILPLARRMLVDAEELASSVGHDASSLTGPVRVGAIDTVAPVVLPTLVRQLATIHAGVRLQITTGDQPVLVNALEGSELDLLITYDIDVPPELSRRALYSTEACLVVSADHRLADVGEASLEAVAGEPMVLLDIHSSRVHTLELMSSRSVTPRIAYRTSNYELCRSLVGQGLGYTLLMRRAHNDRTWDGGRLAFVQIVPPPRAVDVLCMWAPGPLSPRTRAVVDAALLASVAEAQMHD